MLWCAFHMLSLEQYGVMSPAGRGTWPSSGVCLNVGMWPGLRGQKSHPVSVSFKGLSAAGPTDEQRRSCFCF